MRIAPVECLRNTGAMHHAARRLKETHGSVELDTLVDAYGVSNRQFRRLFAVQLGMSPKHYAKVERFSYALRLKRQCPWLTWAQVSQEAGYFDQMHLVNDCKALGAATPTRLLPMIGAPLLPLSDEATIIPASITTARPVPEAPARRRHLGLEELRATRSVARQTSY